MSVVAVSRIVACTSATQSCPSASSDFANSSVRIREQISSGSREPLRSSITWTTSRSAPSKSPADVFWFAVVQPVSVAAIRMASSRGGRRMGARG